MSSVYTLHNKTNASGQRSSTPHSTACMQRDDFASAHLRCRAHCHPPHSASAHAQPSSRRAAHTPGQGREGGAPLGKSGSQCAQYLLFFRPEEEDLPGLNGFEPEELPPPLGFLGAGLSLSEPDEEPEYFSLFLAWWGVGGPG